jgi:nucleotide-binding universal stress UspA family protein
MSNLYKKILIATDGSEHMKKVVPHAIELAKLSGAELHSVYVMYTTTKGLEDYLRNEGEEATNYIEKQAGEEGLSVEKWILKGHPVEEILNLADEQSVDMIVMGTLGRSGIEKFGLGSVADKVIRNSKIPVVTIRR